MFYLLITIFLNVVISVIFKVFPKYNIDTLQAIVANYVVCVITGSLFIGHIPFTASVVHENWFPWALLMGAGFISIFNLLAYCTRIDGITTSIIANKLSLVIPVIFSVFLYGDQMGISKIAGIALAFPAVYLTTRVMGEDHKPQGLFWPLLLFIGGGLLDTLMKYVQFHFLTSADSQAVYSIFCFATAGTIGIILVTTLFLLKKITFQWRNIAAGICIGIPNYFSIYFLIRMLNSNFLQSSAAIPILNIGILVASALTALLLFREKANILRITGLILSVIAILLIAFGDK
ncbi:MAG: EamA/RhaT family transporter [Flavipsychrobacter sp.]|nr:EamA/RhaT family transporter [Flavipsychrobacter sp.]